MTECVCARHNYDEDRYVECPGNNVDLPSFGCTHVTRHEILCDECVRSSKALAKREEKKELFVFVQSWGLRARARNELLVRETCKSTKWKMSKREWIEWACEQSLWQQIRMETFSLTSGNSYAQHVAVQTEIVTHSTRIRTPCNWFNSNFNRIMHILPNIPISMCRCFKCSVWV